MIHCMAIGDGKPTSIKNQMAAPVCFLEPGHAGPHDWMREEKTMADESATLERENQDSVEISRTSKGEVSFKVKCYATTSDAASERARATYDALCVKFLIARTPTP